MNVRTKNSNGETREVLLREYFLNASLIAMLNKVGEEKRRLRKKREARLEELETPFLLS